MTDSINDVNDLIAKFRTICHDFNQPLTVIMARSELMMLKMSPEETDYKSLEQMHQQAEKLAGLVEQLQSLLKGFQKA